MRIRFLLDRRCQVPDVPIRIALGDKLREFREARGLSQEDLAELTGEEVDETTISRIERGERVPRARTLTKLLAHLVDREDERGLSMAMRKYPLVANKSPHPSRRQ